MATYKKTTSGRVCAEIRIKGYKAVSKTHRTKRLAESWAIPIEDEMRAGTYNKSKDDLLSEIFEKYQFEIVPLKKSPRFHITNIKTLNSFFGTYTIIELKPSEVVDYVTMRLKTVKSSTVLKEINTLSTIINTAAVLWGYNINMNVVAQAKGALKNTRALRQPPPRSRRLADGEEDLLINALSDAPKPQLVAILTLQTGRRLNELISIDSSRLQTRKGRKYLKVIDNKTGDNISVPLDDRSSELLEGFEGFNIRNDSVTRAFGRACKRAGIEDLTLNDLRHEAFSRLFEAGWNVPEVMAISGHKNAETLLKIYTQVKGESISEKLARM